MYAPPVTPRIPAWIIVRCGDSMVYMQVPAAAAAAAAAVRSPAKIACTSTAADRIFFFLSVGGSRFFREIFRAGEG